MLLRSYSALYTVHEGMVLIVMLFVILFLEMHFRRQLFKALRLNKQINEGIKLSKQKDMLPILGIISDELEKENMLLAVVSNLT